uniref:Putative potassium channel toxin n=1 Tax=Tityus obscurus TaxID=1221240 RepID=A0A1E1WVW2_TITOB
MKAFYGMLMIFVLCSMCYILVDSQYNTHVKCSESSECLEVCKDEYGYRVNKCNNGRCTCY